ncbi:hypothetical protein DFH08DRAFT_809152 [Mycena albidolilacea]|uniref:Uncharacterized protein n=1 Tax=Mycena albidolilacea TaxID=1033008 RepID=A0AAD7A110_9AGAR|nr:hypothetical protein DFH08DRAFT_809152 [Mycena albidolilacea]
MYYVSKKEIGCIISYVYIFQNCHPERDVKENEELWGGVEVWQPSGAGRGIEAGNGEEESSGELVVTLPDGDEKRGQRGDANRPDKYALLVVEAMHIRSLHWHPAQVFGRVALIGLTPRRHKVTCDLIETLRGWCWGSFRYAMAWTPAFTSVNAVSFAFAGFAKAVNMESAGVEIAALGRHSGHFTTTCRCRGAGARGAGADVVLKSEFTATQGFGTEIFGGILGGVGWVGSTGSHDDGVVEEGEVAFCGQGGQQNSKSGQWTTIKVNGRFSVTCLPTCGAHASEAPGFQYCDVIL